MGASELPSVGELVAGRYRLVEELGRGGMGAVFRATQIGLDRGVAIKLLHPEVSAREDSTARFVREAKVASVFRHPGSVEVYDFGDDDGLLYLVMELLLGETLSAWLHRAGVPPLEEAMDVVVQVARALAAAHELPLVHRDLKPENIFLTRVDGEVRPKIVDFGLAFVQDMGELGRFTTDQMISGTPEFLSPEQATANDIGPPSDVYSLGVILFLMLAGRVPFSGAITQVLAGHVYRTAPTLGDVNTNVPSHIVRLVDAMLAKDPAIRPSALEVAEACSNFSEPVRQNAFHPPPPAVSDDGSASSGSPGQTERFGPPAAPRRDRGARVLRMPSSEGQATADYDGALVETSPQVGIVGAVPDDVLTALSIRNLAPKLLEELPARGDALACLLIAEGFRSSEEMTRALQMGVPVVCAQAVDDMEAIAQLLERGVSDTVSLPLKPDQVARKVGRAISRAERENTRRGAR